MMDKFDGEMCNPFWTIWCKNCYTFHHQSSPPFNFFRMCNRFCSPKLDNLSLSELLFLESLLCSANISIRLHRKVSLCKFCVWISVFRRKQQFVIPLTWFPSYCISHVQNEPKEHIIKMKTLSNY